MTKSVLLLAAVVSLTITAPAFAADDTESTKASTKVEGDSNGNYTKKTNYEHTDAAGTTSTDNTKVKVKTNSKGDVTKTYETDSSNDPKGLMNKTTDKSTTTVKENADGTSSYKHKEKVNGKTVEEENTTSN